MGSPCEQLMSRQPRTSIPCLEKLLQPKVKNPKKIHEQLKEDRQRQKEYHDRTAKERPPLSRNRGVMMLNSKAKKWYPGHITEVYTTQRSYLVRDQETGVISRRTSNHIRPAMQARPPDTSQNRIPAKRKAETPMVLRRSKRIQNLEESLQK